MHFLILNQFYAKTNVLSLFLAFILVTMLISIFPILSFKVGSNVAQSQKYYDDSEIDSKYNVYEPTAKDYENYNYYYKSQFEPSYEPEYHEPEYQFHSEKK